MPSAAAAPTARSGVDDIMSLFGGGGGESALPSRTTASAAPSGMPSDLFASSSSPPPPTAQPAAPSSLLAYTSPSGLTLRFTPNKDASKPNIVNISARFALPGDAPAAISAINFQAAVPKTMKLQMMAISSADLSPGQDATQLMRVMVPPGAQIRLRIRLSYTAQGEQKTEQTDYSFPQGSY
jgi:AP-1 complex subunit gamma-1